MILSRQFLQFVVVTLFLLLSNACTTDQTDVTSETKSQLDPTSSKPTGENASKNCFEWKKDRLPPYYLKDRGIMITRAMSPCLTNSGKNGFHEDTAWMAMGFPCSRGPGTLSWKGPSYKPKMLSFIISNSCPMEPLHLSQVKPIGVEALGFSPTSQLLAYYPFSVQYWEMADQSESDTGHVIEVRIQDMVTKIWKEYQSGVAIGIRLYGRENTFVKSREFYKVDANIKRLTEGTFAITVVNAKSLDESEINEVRSRCQALRPKRDCHKIFTF